MTVTEQLRKAILESGLPQAAIARRAEVPEAVVSRFISAKTVIGGQNLDRLCKALGLKLTQQESPKGTPKGRRM